MFTNNWSAELVEERLATLQGMASGSMPGAERSDAAWPGAGWSESMPQDGEEERTATAAEQHRDLLWDRELKAVRVELAQLRHEKDAMLRRYEVAMAGLDAELTRFRQEYRSLRDHLANAGHWRSGDGETRGVGDATNAETVAGTATRNGESVAVPPVREPDALLLSRPLVVPVGAEFLGVAGRNKPFALDDLLHLVQRNAGSQKVREMRWTNEDTRWWLRIHTQDNEGGHREYLLRVCPTITPSGNAVTVLETMAVDGETVPDKLALFLFKNIREGLEH